MKTPLKGKSLFVLLLLRMQQNYLAEDCIEHLKPSHNILTDHSTKDQMHKYTHKVFHEHIGSIFDSHLDGDRNHLDQHKVHHYLLQLLLLPLTLKL